MHDKSENMLFGVYAVLFGVLFYSAGNFGLLNLLDFRREFQFILCVMLAPLFVIGFGNLHRYIKEPLFLLAFVMFVGELFLRQRDSCLQRGSGNLWPPDLRSLPRSYRSPDTEAGEIDLFEQA